MLHFENNQIIRNYESPEARSKWYYEYKESGRTISDFYFVEARYGKYIHNELQCTEEYVQARSRIISSTIQPISWLDDMCKALDNTRKYEFILDEYQKNRICKFHRESAVFDCSEQGTGKTAMTILQCLSWFYGTRRTPMNILVVAPVSICSQWVQEFSRIGCCLSANIAVEKGNDARKRRLKGLMEIRKTHNLHVPLVVVTNYESLDALEVELTQFLTSDGIHSNIVFDESWKVKNPQANCTKVAIRLADISNKKHCLTGTPQTQTTADLWSQLRILFGPTFVRFSHFCNSYVQSETKYFAGRSQVVFSGCSNYRELFELMSPVYFRATKQMCLSLPLKAAPIQEMLQLIPEQRTRIAKIRRGDMSDYTFASGAPEIASTMLQSVKEQQVCDGIVTNDNWNATIIENNPKYTTLLRYLSEHENEFVIVWMRHVSTIRAYTSDLRERGYNCECVHSKTKNVEDVIARAKTGGIRILVLQEDMGSFGLNLQLFDCHQFFSHTWRVVVKQQQPDRSHRRGRIGIVKQYELIMEGTIDERILASTNAKIDFAVRISPHSIAGDAVVQTTREEEL